MGTWLHRLSEKDTENRTADCSSCGIVSIRKKSNSWRCYYSDKYGSKASYNTKKPKDSICEICGNVTKVFFDHDHNNGKHRGWLCKNCNLVLGFAQDKPEILKRASEYLSR